MVAAAALALLLQVTPAQRAKIAWVPNPRTTTGTWVADPSRRLQGATLARLNAEIGALERETGAEVAVVIVDSTSGLDPFDFALALHRGWGVGKQGRDNGVVFLWVPPQREVRISVGTGLEGVLPDRRTGRILDQQVIPAFRREAWEEGVLAGVGAIIAAAREETGGRTAPSGAAAPSGSGLPGGGVPRAGTAAPVADVQPDGGAPLGLFGALGAIVAAIGGGVGYRRWKRRRPRPCPNGHGMMRLVDEAQDDQYLDEPERLEERLSSVDYDVWLCENCGQTLKLPYRSWTSSYRDCPECRHRTVEVRRTTVRRATTSHEGQEHVVEACRHCTYRKEFDRVLPRVSKSSSGVGSKLGGGGFRGGGGGSSFGGGSARGGGAGRRY